MIYYPGGCDDLDTHSCNDCAEPELGGVRGVALIDQDFVFQDPSNTAEWQAGINAGKINVIPSTNGTYDGGTPVEGPGYGDAPKRLISYTHKLDFKDPDLIDNYDFYNTVKNTRRRKIAYFTETQVWITTKVASIYPKAPVTANVTDEVVYNVTATWVEKNLPKNYAKPDGIVGECFLVS